MHSPRLIFIACAALLGAVYAGEVQTPPRETSPVRAAPLASADSGEDAAEKHQRRTACLRDARARKLVGAQRANFVKNCVENPGET